jgi:hypothetical protein
MQLTEDIAQAAAELSSQKKRTMGNLICCTTIERLEDAQEVMCENEKPGTLKGVLREMSSLTLFPNT